MKINRKLSRLYFSLIGLGALVWFLLRVIPKPSRVTYPCQRAAFPIASAFVIYIVSLISSSFAFLKFKKHWRNGNSWAASVCLIIMVISTSFLLQSDKPYSYANYKSSLEGPNQPIGVGKGIFPGRVVWVHDSTVVIYDITGKKVAELINSYQDAGTYEVTWNGMDNSSKRAASGTYIYSIKTGKFKQSKKMVLIK